MSSWPHLTALTPLIKLIKCPVCVVFPIAAEESKKPTTPTAKKIFYINVVIWIHYIYIGTGVQTFQSIRFLTVITIDRINMVIEKVINLLEFSSLE